jgi:hypothetical protein
MESGLTRESAFRVEAIGDALAQWRRTDSQDQARRMVDTVTEVLDRGAVSRRRLSRATGASQ